MDFLDTIGQLGSGGTISRSYLGYPHLVESATASSILNALWASSDIQSEFIHDYSTNAYVRGNFVYPRPGIDYVHPAADIFQGTIFHESLHRKLAFTDDDIIASIRNSRFSGLLSSDASSKNTRPISVAFQAVCAQ